MLKRLFVILIISQFLINAVWASAHMAVNDHASHSTPHLHANSDWSHLVIQWQVGGEFELSTDKLGTTQNPDDHQVENHFHVHLHAYATSSDYGTTPRKSSEKPTALVSRLTSLTYSPPVPPPNR